MLNLNMTAADARRIAESVNDTHSCSRAESMMYGRAILALVMADTGSKADCDAIMTFTRCLQWQYQRSGNLAGHHPCREQLAETGLA